MSSVVSLDACLHGRSRGGDMAGGEEQSAPMATVARRRGRARGERGKRQGLTANPAEATAKPGRVWSSRIHAGELQWPTMKKMEMALMQSFPGRLAR